MAEKTSLVPLTSSLNYATWAVQVEMALLKDDLWTIVSNPEEAPNPMTPDYRRRREKALATLVLSVDPSLLYLIPDPATLGPAQVWQRLRDQFRRQTW